MEIEILVNANSRHSGLRKIPLDRDDIASHKITALYWHDGEIVQITLKNGYTLYAKAASWNKYTESLLDENKK